jgi:hypothetical protein
MVFIDCCLRAESLKFKRPRTVLASITISRDSKMTPQINDRALIPSNPPIRSIAAILCTGVWLNAQAHDPQFNNGSADDYRRAASLSGDVRAIQAATIDLWPRMSTGTEYTVAPNTVTFTDSDTYLTIQTNNLPDHVLTTTNPNCATSQRYTFKIPKTPQVLDRPRAITTEMQEIGVALNGVVIAGPLDSENKIAPYHRVVDQVRISCRSTGHVSLSFRSRMHEG